MPYQFTITSTLSIAHQTLWTDITQFKNINDEMMPFARMTCPKHLQTLSPDTVPLDTYLFRSIILLFGFLPIDVHHLRLSHFQPHQQFDEHSTSILHRYWKHTRILVPINGDTTQITDKLQFQPRLPLIGYLLLPIYKLVFKNRHQKLQNRYR